jgi:hypothetical protein
MKLLLRSGADPTLRNAQDKTPLDIAQERGHHACEELVSVCLMAVLMACGCFVTNGRTDFGDIGKLVS